MTQKNRKFCLKKEIKTMQEWHKSLVIELALPVKT